LVGLACGGVSNKRDPDTSRFQVCDLTARLPFQDRSFDVVLSNMVLMDLPIVDVPINEFARVLDNDGYLVFSITHPCFFPFNWVNDQDGQKLHKAVRDYCTPRTVSLSFWGETTHYHRSLDAYFGALASAGFLVDGLRESEMSDDDGLPSFLSIRARLGKSMIW
jgi:ubiquinone/menaquinone biosynthesis C-methylase UbiE